MIVDKNGSIARARTTFRALFVATLAATVTYYDKISMAITDDAEELDFGFIADLPGVREWVGDRTIHNLSQANLTIKPKSYELSIGVKRDDILNDKYGTVKPRIADMAGELTRHPDRLVARLLTGGFDTLCWDGQYYFDSDHPTVIDGVAISQSNKGTAAFDAQGTALNAAIAQMQSLKTESGEPMLVTPTHLVVPPQLGHAARTAVKAAVIEGTTNVNQDLVQIVVMPHLAAHPTKWFLLDCSRELKGIIVQRRQPQPHFVAMDKEDDESVFMRKEFRYGADADYGAGYGLWALAYGSTGAGS